MSEPLEIKLPDLSRVALEPGDTLLLRTPFKIDQAAAASMKEQLGKYFPGHAVVIMTGEVELAIVRPVDRDRGDREIESFAFPKVPLELRPLFLAVSNVVMEELREPGHRADLVEATLQNRIRHAFEVGLTS